MAQIDLHCDRRIPIMFLLITGICVAILIVLHHDHFGWQEYAILPGMWGLALLLQGPAAYSRIEMTDEAITFFLPPFKWKINWGEITRTDVGRSQIVIVSDKRRLDINRYSFPRTDYPNVLLIILTEMRARNPQVAVRGLDKSWFARCPKCKEDLRKAHAPECPKCGRSIDPRLFQLLNCTSAC